MVKPTRITNQIRALRFLTGQMAQGELADSIGVTRQTVNAIEQGKYSPSLEVAFKIRPCSDQVRNIDHRHCDAYSSTPWESSLTVTWSHLR